MLFYCTKHIFLLLITKKFIFWLHFACNKKKSHYNHLNQVHLGPFERIDEVELDPVAGVAWTLFVVWPLLDCVVTLARTLLVCRFSSLVLVSARRWSSSAVRKNAIVVNWCLSCEQCLFLFNVLRKCKFKAKQSLC